MFFRIFCSPHGIYVELFDSSIYVELFDSRVYVELFDQQCLG